MKVAKSILLEMSNGLKIPALGLGTWKSKPDEVREAVKHAVLNAGYRHIDCAFIYQNENEVGAALKEIFSSSSLKRSDLFITSKCWNTFHSQKKVMEAIKKTLSDLGLDYLDLYLVHWPMGFMEGGDYMPIDSEGKVIPSDVHFLETWKGMEDTFDAGLTKSIGVSNFNSAQLDQLLSNCRIKPVMNQIEVQPYLAQNELIEHCKKHNIMVTSYSPLGSKDRVWAKPSDPLLLEDPRLKEIAAKYSKSVAQVLIRYQLQRNLVVIPKSVNPSRISENIDVFDFELNQDDMKTIENMNIGWRIIPFSETKSHPLYPFNTPF